MADISTNMPSADTTVSSKRDASLGELVSELSQEAMTLARKEIELAKVEMTEKINKVVKDLVFLAAGGAVAYLGLFFILFAVAEALSEAMPEWLAFAIVGLVLAVVGYVLVQKGMNEMKEINPVPQQTVETLKEDKEWAQRQL